MQSKELLLLLFLQPLDLLPDLTQEFGQGLGSVRHSHLDKSWLLNQNIPCHNIPTHKHSTNLSTSLSNNQNVDYFLPCYKKSLSFIRTVFYCHKTLLLFIIVNFFNDHFACILIWLKWTNKQLHLLQLSTSWFPPSLPCFSVYSYNHWTFLLSCLISYLLCLCKS